MGELMWWGYYSKRLEKQIQEMEEESESKKMEVCSPFSVQAEGKMEKGLTGNEVYQLQTQMQGQH